MRRKYPNLRDAGAISGPELTAWYCREYCRLNHMSLVGHA